MKEREVREWRRKIVIWEKRRETECGRSESVREKETALRDEIPTALTLNTYYTLVMLSISLLYLYRDRIYDVLYVILYLYGLLHTLSPKLPFSPRGRANVVWYAKSAGEEKWRRRRKRRMFEKTKEAWTASNMLIHTHIYPFLFGGRYRSDLEIFAFGAESLLRKILTVMRPTEKRSREAWCGKDQYGGGSGPRG